MLTRGYADTATLLQKPTLVDMSSDNSITERVTHAQLGQKSVRILVGSSKDVGKRMLSRQKREHDITHRT